MGEQEKILGAALVEACSKLHGGKPLEITISSHLDANGIRGIESAIRSLYRTMFDGDLTIAKMKRGENHMLHITLEKLPGTD